MAGAKMVQIVRIQQFTAGRGARQVRAVQIGEVLFVIPAKAGIQTIPSRCWIAAFAGTTTLVSPCSKPQCQAPKGQEHGHASQDNERLTDITMRLIGTQLQVGAGRENARPKYERGSQNYQWQPGSFEFHKRNEWNRIEARSASKGLAHNSLARAGGSNHML